MTAFPPIAAIYAPFQMHPSNPRQAFPRTIAEKTVSGPSRAENRFQITTGEMDDSQLDNVIARVRLAMLPEQAMVCRV
jgi:hypothetical protein